MEKNHGTTIRVSFDVRDRLKDLGKKSDTYEDIVVRLISFYEQHKDQEVR